ncbi:MAG: hypothetical protein PWR09_931 [Archaeoglobi archaeon]|nr:hypothetical protein [Archaeoglobi archaeon]
MDQLQPEFGISLSSESCGQCLVCIRSCPFDAIEEKEEKVEINPEACQYCGICASSCPAGALEIFHYNYEVLRKLVDEVLSRKDEISFACRANPEAESSDIRLPCLGRLPAEILSYSVSRGARKIKLMPCDENFCRFEQGSRALVFRASLLNALLENLGAGEISVERLSSRVRYDERRCIACGYCAFICPYEALSFSAESTVLKIDEEKCMGCGKCVSVCPVFALEIEGYENEKFEAMVSEALEKGARRIYLGCRWSDYERFAEMRIEGENAFIPVVCSGFISENLVLHALWRGAEEVIVNSCIEDNCRLEKGNELAEKRVEGLRETLKSLGLHERVRFSSSSPKFHEKGGNA